MTTPPTPIPADRPGGFRPDYAYGVGMSGVSILVLLLGIVLVVCGAIFARQQSRMVLGIILIVLGVIAVVYSITGLPA